MTIHTVTDCDRSGDRVYVCGKLELDEGVAAGEGTVLLDPT